MEDIRVYENVNFCIRNVGFVNVARNRGYTFSYADGKELYSFVYVENGELAYTFLQETVTKGSAVFIPKKLPYEVRYLQDDTKIKIIIFDLEDGEVPALLSQPHISLTDKPVFDSITKANMMSPLFLSAKVYELLYRACNHPKAIPSKYQKILPALDAMQQRYFENQSIAHYADLCGMSQSNFRKLFTEYTGMSPISYRNQIRMAEVKQMLDSGEFKVCEAAYLAGFNNMAFFYELLRRHIQKPKNKT